MTTRREYSIRLTINAVRSCRSTQTKPPQYLSKEILYSFACFGSLSIEKRLNQSSWKFSSSQYHATVCTVAIVAVKSPSNTVTTTMRALVLYTTARPADPVTGHARHAGNVRCAVMAVSRLVRHVFRELARNASIRRGLGKQGLTLWKA